MDWLPQITLRDENFLNFYFVKQSLEYKKIQKF